MTVFDTARSLSGNKLDQTQVDSINAIMGAWLKFGDIDDRKLAYILATAQHESNFRPISENLNYTTAERIKTVWPARFKTVADAQPYVKNPQKLANLVYGGKLGNTEPNDGWDYRGRGLCQITGKANYAKFSPLVEYDLVETPDFAKSIDPAARILVIGLMKGLFTGKKIGDFVNDKMTDFFNARAVVNGDKGRLEGKISVGMKVANSAHAFLSELEKSPVPDIPAPKPSTGHIGPEIEDEDPIIMPEKSPAPPTWAIIFGVALVVVCAAIGFIVKG